MGKQPANIVDASRETAALPSSRSLRLPGGKVVEVRRLNWLQFELLWTELAGLMALLLDERHGQDEPELAAELAAAPQLVLKLTQQATGIAEAELAQWHFDDVLLLAAEAIRLNFTEPAGLRSFFLSASGLLGRDGAGQAAGQTTRPPSTD